MTKKKTKREVKIDAKKQAQFYGAVNIENWTTFGLGNVPINVAIDKLLRIVDVAGAVGVAVASATATAVDYVAGATALALTAAFADALAVARSP